MGEKMSDQILSTKTVVPKENGFLFTSTGHAIINKIKKGLGFPGINILLQGETGVGKTWLARQGVQFFDQNLTFVDSRISCLSPELIASELFGHVKGAFTGAVSSKIGLVERAKDGILFLDEVGHLPLSVQVMLLKLFEQGVYCRVGESIEKKFSGKIISATNKNLVKMIEERLFLADLYYRIRGYAIVVPPLRERNGEALVFAKSILDTLNRRYDLTDHKQFEHNFQKKVSEYHWPGNLRELSNEITTAFLDSETAFISLECPSKSNESCERESHESSLEQIEKDNLIKAMWSMNGVNKKAAQILGISERVICYKLKKYGIDRLAFQVNRNDYVNLKAIVKDASEKIVVRLPDWVLTMPENKISKMVVEAFNGSNQDVEIACRKINLSYEELSLLLDTYKSISKKMEEEKELKLKVVGALRESNGNKKSAVKILGIHYAAIFKLIKRYRIVA